MYLHLLFSFLSISILLIILANSLKHQRDEEQRKSFIYIILSSVFTNMIAEIFEMGKTGFVDLSIFSIKIINCLIYIGTLCMCHSWYLFVTSQAKVSFFNKSAVRNTVGVIFSMIFVLDISSVWTGLVFNITEEGVHSHGYLRYVSVGATLFFVVLSLAEVMIKIHSSKDKSHMFKYRCLGMFTMLPILFQGIFLILRNKAGIDLPLQCYGTTVAVVFGYIYILENTRQHEQKKLFDITNALSLDYGSVFYVNAVNNSMQIMRLDDFVKNYCLRLLDHKNNYEEIIAYCSDHLIYSDDRSTFYQYLQIPYVRDLLLTRDSYTFDFRGNIPSSYKFLRIKLIKTDSDVDHFIIGLKDISSEVEKQHQYHEDLQNALIEAQTANKAKSVFLSNMSHDIRTPMNAIIGFTDIAKDSLDDRKKIADCLEKISSSSNHLLSLINDVLDMSRIENGKMNLENTEVNMSGLLDDVKNIISSQIVSKNLNFEMKKYNVIHENLYMDPLRVKQIFLNILSNSMKFTQIGGSILFEVTERNSNKPGYAYYHFTISDNGCGMSQDFLKKVFEPFARERNTTDSGISGTGLGMTIVKNIVQQLGGSVTVASREGAGTDFHVDLSFKICEKTLSDNKEIKNTAAEEKSYDLSGVRVLLVEDNELNREIAKNILIKNKAEVTELINCRQAVDLVIQSDTKCFDLILMDIQTPFMNGYDATRAIRGLVNHPMQNVPIIAMTANAFEEDRQAALNSGMNDHVAKPIRLKTLMTSITNVLHKTQQ